MPVIGAEITREEQKVLDALDFTIPCARKNVPEHEAHYAMKCKTCPDVGYLCTQHLAEIRAIVASPRCSGVACGKCEGKGRWLEDVYLVVPL